jgi:hypothetical protein
MENVKTDHDMKGPMVDSIAIKAPTTAQYIERPWRSPDKGEESAL